MEQGKVIHSREITRKSLSSVTENVPVDLEARCFFCSHSQVANCIWKRLFLSCTYGQCDLDDKDTELYNHKKSHFLG